MSAEGRRSPRVLLKLSVLIEDPPPACPARTAVVNRQGAMLLSPRPYALGSEPLLRHLEWEGSARFNVVWDGGTDEAGSHKIGIEMLEAWPDFWGPEYEKAVRAGA